jgi:hypothetical protein
MTTLRLGLALATSLVLAGCVAKPALSVTVDGQAAAWKLEQS